MAATREIEFQAEKRERAMVIRPEVTVVDYGMGNINSLVSALTYVGAEVEVSRDPSTISRSSTMVLPGVGSFPAAMSIIRQSRLDIAIYEAIEKPTAKILGICLGMQLFGLKSTEDGGALGLNILNFEVQEFGMAREPSLPLPHIGFNSVSHNPQSSLFRGLGDSADYYFVHEFQCVAGSTNALESKSTYGESFLAAIEDGRVFGTQFHPEKSQTNGLKVLANFVELPL